MAYNDGKEAKEYATCFLMVYNSMLLGLKYVLKDITPSDLPRAEPKKLWMLKSQLNHLLVTFHRQNQKNAWNVKKPIEAPAGDLSQAQSKEASKSEIPVEQPPGDLQQAESKEAMNAEKPIEPPCW